MHHAVKSGTTCYTITGADNPSGSDTNENRGYMLSGYCNNVTGNSGHINRQKAGSSGYETVDGEGILHQSENGNPGYGCVPGMARMTLCPAPPPLRVPRCRDNIVNNDLSGGSSGYIGALPGAIRRCLAACLTVPVLTAPCPRHRPVQRTGTSLRTTTRLW